MTGFITSQWGCCLILFSKISREQDTDQRKIVNPPGFRLHRSTDVYNVLLYDLNPSNVSVKSRWMLNIDLILT